MKRAAVTCGLLALLLSAAAQASPPSWLVDLSGMAVPKQAADVEAVQLLYEESLKVTADGKMHRQVRSAFRMLRQSAESRAVLKVSYDNWSRVKAMQGWTIPASGKAYEARFKDSVETALIGVDDSTLVSDVRTRVLPIPGAHPGDTVGYEYEVEETGPQLADDFAFQRDIPVLQARYSLELPAGWSMVSSWTHHAVVEPEQGKPQTWQWTLRDEPRVVGESYMPSWSDVAGRLYVAFAPAGSTPQLASWQGIGAWSEQLAQDRRAASPQIRQKVAELIAGTLTPLERLRALAAFVQQDIRYVAIELGIGGFQPHAAAEVFANRFGDCKDKSTLLGVMLAEAGIESTPVLINTDRAVVRADTPPGLRFNHFILAVRLPADTPVDGLLSVIDAPGGGHLLFFDATDEVTPVGRLPGELQGAYGLLTTREDARLVQLPRASPADSGVHRTATLKLDEQGTLSGDVTERVLGDAARWQRYELRFATKDTDTVKPLEKQLSRSLARFDIEGATLRYRKVLQQPLEWNYKLRAEGYASPASGLLMVRPRVVGVLARDLSDQVAARVHDLSFDEVRMDQDEVAIELPPGYVVESLPDAIDMDVGFAAYHSHAAVVGSQLRYTRSYELRELSVPAAKFEDFRKLQRAIARDERASVVLKSAGK